MPTNYFDPTSERDHRDKFTKYRRNFIICPEQWETLSELHTDMVWSEAKFEEASQSSIPQNEGLYMFVASSKKANASFLNYLFYVGETNNLRRRFGEYLAKTHKPKSGQYKMYTIIDEFPSNLYFFFVSIPGISITDRKKIEEDFLVGFLPPINSKYPQQLQSIVLAAYGR